MLDERTEMLVNLIVENWRKLPESLRDDFCVWLDEAVQQDADALKPDEI